MLKLRLSIPLRVDSKFFIVVAFLPVEVRCSEITGELLCALEILRRAPGLASVVIGREESASLLMITASRLLETTARLDDPLDRTKLELDNCMNPSKKWVRPEYKSRTKLQCHHGKIKQ